MSKQASTAALDSFRRGPSSAALRTEACERNPTPGSNGPPPFLLPGKQKAGPAKP